MYEFLLEFRQSKQNNYLHYRQTHKYTYLNTNTHIYNLIIKYTNTIYMRFMFEQLDKQNVKN